MTGPRIGMGMPANDSWVAEQLANLQRQITELRSARTLDASVTSPTGTTTFNGNVVIGGTLSLPNGIINNAALAAPITVGIANGTSGSLTFTSTETVYDTETLTVPAGFTQALVLAIATTGLTASAASVCSARAVINGVDGDRISSVIASGAAIGISAPMATVLTGLSGSFTVACKGTGTTGACSAGTGNARVSAIAVFLR